MQGNCQQHESHCAVAGSRDRTVKLWDLSAGMLLATKRSPVGSVRSLAVDEDLLVPPAQIADDD